MDPGTWVSRELVGWIAAALVLATFCVRRMVPLRVLAIASNFAFISYGALAGIHPVLLLHLVLLPTNAVRLVQALNERGGGAPRLRRAPPRAGAAPSPSRAVPCDR